MVTVFATKASKQITSARLDLLACGDKEIRDLCGEMGNDPRTNLR